MSFPKNRMRRLRTSSSMRRLVRRSSLSTSDLVYPLFVKHGKGLKEPIKSMRDCFHFSPDTVVKEDYTASSFEAVEGHRGLFLLPQSFAALFARDPGDSVTLKFFVLLFIISPSIILGLLLAWRVKRDAVLIGLSSDVRKLWFIGTVAFGLPAYITYRLTRPKETLVTCENCGKLRRPDMITCHNCSSKWYVPELIAPTWRVKNRG